MVEIKTLKIDVVYLSFLLKIQKDKHDIWYSGREQY